MICQKIAGINGEHLSGKKIWQSFMSKAHEGLEPLEFLPYARISDDLLQQQESGSGQPEDNPAEETPEEERRKKRHRLERYRLERYRMRRHQSKKHRLTLKIKI